MVLNHRNAEKLEDSFWIKALESVGPVSFVMGSKIRDDRTKKKVRLFNGLSHRKITKNCFL